MFKSRIYKVDVCTRTVIITNRKMSSQYHVRLTINVSAKSKKQAMQQVAAIVKKQYTEDTVRGLFVKVSCSGCFFSGPSYYKLATQRKLGPHNVINA